MVESRHCPLCGSGIETDDEPIIRRGAVTIALDPVIVRWRGRYVPFSRVEANLFAVFARRGRLLYSEVDAAIKAIGASPATRSVVLGRMRRKMMKIGSCNPFERVGTDTIQLIVDADEDGNRGLFIGDRRIRFKKNIYNN